MSRPDQTPLRYCHSPYGSARRRTRPVMVGSVGVGGDHPVRVQSMLISDTRDTGACVQEALGLVEAGCEIVRLTAQTRKYAANLEHIKARLLAEGCDAPLVADIHFKPDAALEAAKWVEKVRVNPGNYADSKKFNVREYSDAEYAAELERLRERFLPLVELCQKRGVAMRIGTNHGSLSDRIMNRYGDSPLGMVESALEFARIAREAGYHAFIFSMKASNPKVMVEAYRLLAARLDALGPDWNYPIHLGVTEAGDGEDGRIKSAIGIGALLADGIGDTIRVSLTEDAVHEIPVAQALVRLSGENDDPGTSAPGMPGEKPTLCYDPFSFARRASQPIEANGVALGGENPVRVFTSRVNWDAILRDGGDLGELRPEFVVEEAGVEAIDPRDAAAVKRINASPDPQIVTVADGIDDLSVIAAFRMLTARIDARHPVLLKDTLGTPGTTDETSEPLDALLTASTNMGALLCDGLGDAVLVQSEKAAHASVRLAYNILQAAGARIFKTDYVACPSCGRTLFNLQTTTARIREATGHLKGIRIAVMGCIVNGPGEMADADFGYVGGAPDKINLYVGKEPVNFNIPEGEAVERLIDLIKDHNRWVEPGECAPQTGTPQPVTAS